MTKLETLELDGYRKAYALLLKGMGSQAELMDDLKQQVRDQAAELERLRVKAEAYGQMAADANTTLGGIARNERLRDAAVRVVAERDGARALAARLAEALAPFVPHPDVTCGNDDVHGRAQSALADARAAGLAGEGGQ